ncbi:hypothetical protein BDF21DRAFT_395283 [Thamnidium elegans]|nr:hypothetical protein BDF21DRAFT_395283 [Thamnidium elegans]
MRIWSIEIIFIFHVSDLNQNQTPQKQLISKIGTIAVYHVVLSSSRENATEIHRIAPPSRSDLIPNIGNQNNYCVACDKTFSSGQSYLTHQSSFPIYETPEIYLGRDSKNPTYLNNKNYQHHLVHAHNLLTSLISKRHVIRSNLEPVVDPLNKYCNVCDKVYRSLSIYQYHV